MSIIGDVQSWLENWAVFKRMRAAIDKIESLEKRIAELESERQVGPPRSECPRCGENRFMLISSAPDTIFGPVGGMRRLYRCSACQFEESKLVE